MREGEKEGERKRNLETLALQFHLLLFLSFRIPLSSSQPTRQL